MCDSVKNCDDWGPLERSLRVVNWDFNGFLQKLGRVGFLRTLATGSELGFQWFFFSKILGWLGFFRTLATCSEWGILSKIGMMWGSLELSLRVAHWDFNGFFPKIGMSGVP